MKSFQEAFYLETSSPARRVWRNLRLFGYVLQIVWTWLVTGGRVRRRIRRARASGARYYVDELAR